MYGSYRDLSMLENAIAEYQTHEFPSIFHWTALLSIEAELFLTYSCVFFHPYSTSRFHIFLSFTRYPSLRCISLSLFFLPNVAWFENLSSSTLCIWHYYIRQQLFSETFLLSKHFYYPNKGSRGKVFQAGRILSKLKRIENSNKVKFVNY